MLSRCSPTVSIRCGLARCRLTDTGTVPCCRLVSLVHAMPSFGNINAIVCSSTTSQVCLRRRPGSPHSNPRGACYTRRLALARKAPTLAPLPPGRSHSIAATVTPAAALAWFWYTRLPTSARREPSLAVLLWGNFSRRRHRGLRSRPRVGVEHKAPCVRK